MKSTIILVTLGSLLISACGGPAEPAAPKATSVPAATTAPQVTQPLVATQSAPKPAEVRADIKLFQYQPNPVEIKVGTTVTWTNQDDIQHSVTQGTPPTPGKEFDSGLFEKGKTFSFTFTKPGEFAYFCTRHNSLVGVVKVSP